jgi:hypothetical protein
MPVRMQVENPGRKAKRMTKAKKKTAKRKNPGKRRAKRNPATTPRKRRRKNPASAAPRRRRAAKRNPTRARARRRNGRRRSRKNPGWSNTSTAFMALAAGVGAAVVSSWVSDGPLGRSSTAVQNLALILEGAAAIYWIENPAVLGGVIVGLGLVQAGDLIYQVFPTLAAPTPGMGMGGPAAGATPATMGTLHRRTVQKIRGIDQGMATLHRGGSMGTLHRGMGQLHRGQPMGAMQNYRLGAPRMSGVASDRGNRGVSR